MPRGDPPPALLRPFHQDHGAPERGHDPVARREAPGARRHAPGELAEDEPAAGDARVEAGVAARVDDVGAAAEHGDGRERRAGVRVQGRLLDGCVGLDGRLLRDGVDPEGEPADDHDAGAGEAAGEHPRHVLAVGRGRAGADDRDERRLDEGGEAGPGGRGVRPAADEQAERRIRQVAELVRVERLAPRHHDIAGRAALGAAQAGRRTLAERRREALGVRRPLRA